MTLQIYAVVGNKLWCTVGLVLCDSFERELFCGKFLIAAQVLF